MLGRAVNLPCDINLLALIFWPIDCTAFLYQLADFVVSPCLLANFIRTFYGIRIFFA